MDKKPAKFSLFVGVSAPSIQPDDYGTTYEDQSSYGMWSYGGVMAAGQLIISDITKLPASSITQADLLEQRERGTDKMLSAGDEVVVVLDCTALTLRLQSPTVQHVIDIQQQHQQQPWVLNVNFGRVGDYQLTLS